MIPNETLSFHDRLVLFGFGLFETLLVTEKGPLFVDLHWQRMNMGAGVLNLNLPDINEWLKRILEFIEQTSTDTFPYALRVTLSGGSPLANLPSQLLFHKRLPSYTSEQYNSGIRLHLLPSPRNEQSPLVSIKSTNYLENILAKEESLRKGADEGLWLNSKGYLAEGTMSNLFFIKDQILFTPSLSSGCLSGTRRQIILGLARSMQIPTEEGLYPLSDLLLADEVFMTNALMGLMPVRQVANHSLQIPPPDLETSTMRKLQLVYNILIMNSFSPFYNFHV